jgi:hypothetical protein
MKAVVVVDGFDVGSLGRKCEGTNIVSLYCECVRTCITLADKFRCSLFLLVTDTDINIYIRMYVYTLRVVYYYRYLYSLKNLKRQKLKRKT